jgi:hypothetical protein
MMGNQQHPGEERTERPYSVHGTEPSTALRLMGITMACAKGDLVVDYPRMFMETASTWQAEAKSEQDLNHRLMSSIHDLMGKIAPTMEKFKVNGEHKDWLDTYGYIQGAMSSCNIVLVESELAGIEAGHQEYKITLRMAVRNLKTNKTETTDALASMACSIENFDKAIDTMTENGYRLANCSAKHLYYEAWKLANLIGFIKADEHVDLRAVKAEDADRKIEDYRDLRRPRA